MIAEEGKLVDVDVMPKLMNFDTLSVVNVDILLLRYSEEGLIVKPAEQSLSDIVQQR